jgi:hypothetical protein
MHRFRWTDLALMLVLLAPLSAAAHAQSDSAEISGRITDPTGALIGGAVVELSDTARGTVQKATSNHDGIYVFPFVKPGRYSVSVGAAGFHRVDLVSLTANTQDHIEQNFKLEVGSSSESLTVSSDAKVDVGTSISTSVDHRFIENMPLSGQSIQQLIAITPGVQRTSGAGQFSFNGMRDNANYITVDGVSANTGRVRRAGTAPLAPVRAWVRWATFRRSRFRLPVIRPSLAAAQAGRSRSPASREPTCRMVTFSNTFATKTSMRSTPTRSIKTLW